MMCFPNPSGDGFLLELQADLLSDLNTRVVAPLLPATASVKVIRQAQSRLSSSTASNTSAVHASDRHPPGVAPVREPRTNFARPWRRDRRRAGDAVPRILTFEHGSVSIIALICCRHPRPRRTAIGFHHSGSGTYAAARQPQFFDDSRDHARSPRRRQAIIFLILGIVLARRACRPKVSRAGRSKHVFRRAHVRLCGGWSALCDAGTRHSYAVYPIGRPLFSKHDLVPRIAAGRGRDIAAASAQPLPAACQALRLVEHFRARDCPFPS